MQEFWRLNVTVFFKLLDAIEIHSVLNPAKKLSDFRLQMMTQFLSQLWELSQTQMEAGPPLHFLAQQEHRGRSCWLCMLACSSCSSRPAPSHTPALHTSSALRPCPPPERQVKNGKGHVWGGSEGSILQKGTGNDAATQTSNLSASRSTLFHPSVCISFLNCSCF